MGAPKLTPETIEKAVRLLDAWVGKLTWDRYLSVLEGDIGHKYTKAAMLRQPRIADAWSLAKERSQEAAGSEGYGHTPLALAKQRIKERDNTIERLTRENEKLLKQFVRWAHNASVRGLTPADLDKPIDLPKKD